jgi:NADH-quinone oxidoreductase subunit N
MKVLMPVFDYSAVMPQTLLGVAGLLVLLLGLFIPKRRQELLAVLSIIFLNVTVVSLFFGKGVLGSLTLNQMVLWDGFSILFSLLFIVSSAFVVAVSIPFVNKEDVPPGEYYSLLIFATMGMVLMATTTDLLIIFLGLELMSISLYILASITRTNDKAAEAGMKYLIMGAFSSAFLLYGIAFIYGATGSTNLIEISRYIAVRPHGYYEWMLPAGIGLILVGLGFKVGLVPFHMWIPDVYEGAPTIVTAFMSIGPKAAGFAALARFFLLGPFLPNHPFGNIPWPVLLAGLAGLTMTIGNLIAIAQSNIKRMLAYSSIAHAGYVMVGLVTASKSSVCAIYFYMVAYFLMNLGAFAIVYALQGENGRGLALKRYMGLGYKKPGLALVLSVFLLSLTGFPLTAGFMGKFILFRQAVDAGLIGLVLVAVINSVISAYYYLRVVVYMYMHDPEENITVPEIPAMVTFVAGLCLIGVLYFGTLPQGILKVIYLLMSN